MKRNIIIIIVFFIAAILITSYIDKQNSRDASGSNPPPVPAAISPEAPGKVEVVTYANASADLIEVELPFPGAVVGKEFSVLGRARGNWFFEASFPLKVLDKDGKVLAEHYAEAQGEWMTSEFVPFKGDLAVPASYIGPATLVLEKDNASGLPEHDASISFPIIIEY